MLAQRRCAIFGYVARLGDRDPANLALRSLSLGRFPSHDW